VACPRPIPLATWLSLIARAGLGCVVALLLAVGTVQAQDSRARITGKVTDPSGSPIPGAEISVTSVATGVVSNAKSNDAGIYLVGFLQPGEYEVKISAQGFKILERTGVKLQTGQVAEIDAPLAIGVVGEKIEVSAEPALLDTATGGRTHVFDEKLLAEAAIPARNPMLVANQLPGVTYRGAGIFYQPFANGAIAGISINGGQQGNNELLLDGAPNNSSARQANNIALIPPGEAVQEVAVSTNLYDASLGKTTGGVVNIVLKGGSKDFHATGWGFLRRGAWNANRFQNNANNSPKPPQQVDHYGFVVSGPIFVPGLLTDKSSKKLFGLFSFEDFNELSPAPFTLSYPATEMRNGDFSRLANGAGQRITVHDPFSIATGADGIERRAPFANNIIPANRIQPFAQRVLNFYPQPNVATPPGVTYSQRNYAQPNFSYPLLYRSYMGRVDTVLSERSRINIRYVYSDHDQNRQDNGINGPGQRGFAPYVRTNHAGLVDWVHTINPATVLNLRGNVSRYVEGSDSPANLNFDSSSLGLSSRTLGQLAVPNFFGTYNFGPYAGLGPDAASVLTDYTTTYSLQGTLSKVTGRHQMKAGMDARDIRQGRRDLGLPFFIDSGTSFTQAAFGNAAASINSGDNIASFLLGAPNTIRADFQIRPFIQQWYVAPFFQDDWQVNRRLTLNLGLRWDLNTTPRERYDRQLLDFDPTAKSPLTLPPDRQAQFPGLNVRGDYRYAGVNGNRQRVANNYLGTFQPRVGVAYQVTDRWVLRGGYGLFYANWPTQEFLDGNSPGFSTTTVANISPDGGRTPFADLYANPFPQGVVPGNNNPSPAFFLGRGSSFFNPDAKLPRVHQFSAGLQYKLSSGSMIDVSYVGNRTTNQTVQVPTNIPSYDLYRNCDPLAGGVPSFCLANEANPFQGNPAFVGTTGLGVNAVTNRYEANRPFRQYSSDMVRNASNLGKVWYDAAQISYRARLRQGLVFDANYTFSKNLQLGDNNVFLAFQNAYTRELLKTVTAQDRTHAFKLSGHYELPFGRGKRFLSGRSGFVSRLVGGWDVNALTNIFSGEPANLPQNAVLLKDPRIGNSVDTKQYRVRGWNGCVAQLLPGGGWTPLGGATGFPVARNGCSPTDLGDYAWGIIPFAGDGRYLMNVNPIRSSQLRMPYASTTDLSLNKTTQITEKLRFQLRIEAFNAFNRYNLFTLRYNNNPSDPNFGTYFPGDNSSTFSPQSRDSLPRNIQLGMKLMW
jgi:hypothetical protein